MIVICRFHIAGEWWGFVEQAEAAAEVLAAAEGCRSVEVGRNLDEPGIFVLVSRWRDVGSYRRALQSFEARTVVVPLLSMAIDEPSAYDDVDLVGRNLARGSDPAGLS